MPDVTTPDFVNIDLILDSVTLSDNAIEDLRATWADWEPDEADPEVILIEEVSPMASSVAAMCATMTKEALRALGTKMYGIPYDRGTPASTEVTFTMVDTAGYRIQAGSQINIDGYAFAPAANVDVPPGSDTIAHVTVYATVDPPTADANGLTGDTVLPLTLPPYVIDTVVERATADGKDPMDDDTYLNLVVGEMVLRTRTLINARDFALDALEVAGVARSRAVQSAARHVTVTVAGPDGLPVSTAIKDIILARWDTARDVAINVTYAVNDYNYCTVAVNWTVEGLSTVDAATIRSVVNGVLTNILSPAVWPLGATVPKAYLLAAINVAGIVAYPSDLTLSSPTGGAVVQPNGDLLMPGASPLPQVGTLAGTVNYP